MSNTYVIWSGSSTWSWLTWVLVVSPLHESSGKGLCTWILAALSAQASSLHAPVIIGMFFKKTVTSVDSLSNKAVFLYKTQKQGNLIPSLSHGNKTEPKVSSPSVSVHMGWAQQSVQTDMWSKPTEKQNSCIHTHKQAVSSLALRLPSSILPSCCWRETQEQDWSVAPCSQTRTSKFVCVLTLSV